MDSTPYSCICGQLVLTITPSLTALPLRQTGQTEKSNQTNQTNQPTPIAPGHDDEPKTYVIPRNHPACSFKLETKKDRTPVAIARGTAKELWWVLRCPRCRLPVGYDLDEEDMKFDYILDGSLSEVIVDRARAGAEE